MVCLITFHVCGTTKGDNVRCERAHRPLVACMARVEPLEVCISFVGALAESLQLGKRFVNTKSGSGSARVVNEPSTPS